MHGGYSSWTSYICHGCDEAYRVYLPSCSCCGSGSVSLADESCMWCGSGDTEEVTNEAAQAFANQSALK